MLYRDVTLRHIEEQVDRCLNRSPERNEETLLDTLTHVLEYVQKKRSEGLLGDPELYGTLIKQGVVTRDEVRDMLGFSQERKHKYQQALKNIALICSGETGVGGKSNPTTDDEGRLTQDAKKVIQDLVTKALKQ